MARDYKFQFSPSTPIFADVGDYYVVGDRNVKNDLTIQDYTRPNTSLTLSNFYLSYDGGFNPLYHGDATSTAKNKRLVPVSSTVARSVAVSDTKPEILPPSHAGLAVWDQAGTLPRSYLSNSNVQTNALSKEQPRAFIDSTLGITTGQRLLFTPEGGIYRISGRTATRLRASVPFFKETWLAQPIGTVNYYSTLGTGFYADNVWVIDETTTHVYVMQHAPYDPAVSALYATTGTAVGTSRHHWTFWSLLNNVYRISKADWTSTALLVYGALTTNHVFDQTKMFPSTALRYLGRMSTDLHLFVRVPRYVATVSHSATTVMNEQWSHMVYYTLNTTTGAFTISDISSQSRPMHESNQNPTFSVPTTLIDEDSNFKMWYYASMPTSSSSDIRIFRQRVPKTLVGANLTTTNPGLPSVDSNRTLCTLSGAPALKVPYTGILSTSGVATNFIIYNELGSSTIVNPLSVTSSDWYHDGSSQLFEFKDGADQFLVLFNIPMVGKKNNTYNQCTSVAQKVYVFKVNAADTSNLIYIQTIEDFAAGDFFSGLCRTPDNMNWLLSSDSSFFTLTWNTGTKLFDKSRTITPTYVINRLAFDTSKNIWAEDSTGKMRVFSMSTYFICDVTYDGTVHTYIGNPINSSISVSVTNGLGTLVAKPVNLTISGAVFQANNLTTLSITTGTGSPTVVPIVINSPGKVIVTTAV